MRTIVVGDVHGCYDELVALMEKVALDRAQDKIIFLGDYLDRGEKPQEVFAYLKALKEEMGDRCVLLYGNHEDLFYKWFSSRSEEHRVVWFWDCNGGVQNLTKLLTPETLKFEPRNALGPYLHWILNHTALHYSDENMQCVHAAPIHDMEAVSWNSRHEIHKMLWYRGYLRDTEDESGKIGSYFGKLTFVGHNRVHQPTLSKDYKLTELPCDVELDLPDYGIIDIDTGCYKHSVLTAAVVEGKKYKLVQAGTWRD